MPVLVKYPISYFLCFKKAIVYPTQELVEAGQAMLNYFAIEDIRAELL
jgi:hypothetical protein